MKKITSAIFFLCVLFIYSCSNEDSIMPLEEIEMKKEITDNTINFMYKEKLYSSTYHFTPDSLIILHDLESNRVYQQLGSNPDLSVVVKENGLLEYYDSYQDYQNSLSLELNLRTLYPIPQVYFTVDLYEDSSWNGKKISFTIDNKNNTKISIPSLRAYGMNDKISSLKYRCSWSASSQAFVYTESFTLFLHDNYQGYSLTFPFTKVLGPNAANSPQEDAVRRLKDVPLIPGTSTKNNWNDIASSVIIGK
ncbi:MAG: hypothetical protein E6772_06630 [Dysgonomonas sp.]|nr:hypothetical protein [Dysgonomonas sp.]